MRLGLSSAAAPDAGLAELLEALVRRGLAALELREGDGHGVTPDDAAVRARRAAARAAATGVAITGYYTTRVGHDLALARLAYALGAPVIVDGPFDAATRIDRARQMAAVGVDVAVLVRGESAVHDAARAASAGLVLAWEVDLRSGSPGGIGESLLRRFPGRLRHIRLLGGGPETATQEGKGIGELMGRLALAGYEGVLVLAPSTTRYRVAWRNWLGRRGGWGCGSRTAEPSPLQLGAAGIERGER